MKKATVLYVEDEEDDVFFMQMAFKRAGVKEELQSVSDGKRAISYLAGEGMYADRSRHPLPVAILLDLNLPLRSGFEVLEWLRQQPELQDIAVVIFSSSGRPEDRQKAHELGANDYVLKPATGLDFAGVVKGFQERWLVAGPAASRTPRNSEADPGTSIASAKGEKARFSADVEG